MHTLEGLFPDDAPLRRRAPRSVSITPRGSGRSRRATLQRQTRPEARTQTYPGFHALAWGPETTPASLWKLWVTRVCERRRCTLRASSGDVGPRLYAVPRGSPTPQTFRQTRPTGGVRSNRAVPIIQPFPPEQPRRTGRCPSAPLVRAASECAPSLPWGLGLGRSISSL